MLDPAADFSCMRETEFKQSGLNRVVEPRVVIMGSAKVTDLGTAERTIVQAGDKITFTDLRIIGDGAVAPVILSRADCFRLRLLRLDLPMTLSLPKLSTASTVEQAATRLGDVEEELPSVLASVHNEDQTQHDAFLSEIADVLKLNQGLKGFAKVPPVELNITDRTPRNIRQYEIPYVYHPAIREQIQKWLDRGRLRVQRSLWNLPITAAIKKDAEGNPTGVRVCIDPRQLNKFIIADGFPIPRFSEILRNFAKKRFYARVDIEDAFTQLELMNKDKGVLAFTWENVQYCFDSAIYGLKPMSSIFQRTMAEIFSDMDFVYIYIDDIIIASCTMEEHREHVRKVLERLNERNIRISLKKLEVARRSIKILGMEVSEEGIRPDERKVRQIMDWAFPETHKEALRFLGVVAFLRPHIRHVAVLESAFNKGRASPAAYRAELERNRSHMQDSFRILKEAISAAPLLKYPDFNRPFHLAIDASTVGVGAVLYQPTEEQLSLGVDGITSENIVAIASRALSKTRRTTSLINWNS